MPAKVKKKTIFSCRRFAAYCDVLNTPKTEFYVTVSNVYNNYNIKFENVNCNYCVPTLWNALYNAICFSRMRLV